MALSEKQLAAKLLDAGNRLLSSPPSVEHLLPLLHELGRFLERAEQSPSQAMMDALSPSINALVADKLLAHFDPDVRVSVANCISEISRITAPDAPYEDDQMKEIFKLIVSSFEQLYDKSSPSYDKRASILETVAKVRSCLLMLDLECDALILQMFHHFLKSLRDYHPEVVFQSMETIMTLVLEESEEISPELLSSILVYLKRNNNEDVQPIAQKLAEKVLVNCATKVKPYLQQAFKSLRISLNDYKEVVSSVCQASGVVELNNFSKQEAKDTPGESDGTKIPSSNLKKINVRLPSSRTSGNKARKVSSPSPSGHQPEESRSKKAGQRKKKGVTLHESTPEHVVSKKEDDSISGLETKSTKQLHKKDESIGNEQGDKRRRGKGKNLTKTSLEEKDKECDSPRKSAAKSAKKESPAMTSKRKRTASREKVPQTEEYGENFVGSKIRVWWPDDNKYYEGFVDSFDHRKKAHKIVYTDGDEEILKLKLEKWNLVNGDADSDKGCANDDGNLDAQTETSIKKKKVKANTAASNNEDKSEQLVQKAVDGSLSAKAKSTASKRGRKKKGETDVEKKSEDAGSNSSKNTGLDAEDELVKSEESKGGKDSAIETPLGSTKKEKQETSNDSPKSKGKATKGRGSNKSSANGSVKGKAGTLSKGNQAKMGNKSSPDSAKSGETEKGKSSSTPSKAQKSGTKSGRKCQRGSKG